LALGSSLALQRLLLPTAAKLMLRARLRRLFDELGDDVAQGRVPADDPELRVLLSAIRTVGRHPRDVLLASRPDDLLATSRASRACTDPSAAATLGRAREDLVIAVLEYARYGLPRHARSELVDRLRRMPLTGPERAHCLACASPAPPRAVRLATVAAVAAAGATSLMAVRSGGLAADLRAVPEPSVVAMPLAHTELVRKSPVATSAVRRAGPLSEVRARGRHVQSPARMP
jgi:hypothetical protein